MESDLVVHDDLFNCNINAILEEVTGKYDQWSKSAGLTQWWTWYVRTWWDRWWRTRERIGIWNQRSSKKYQFSFDKYKFMTNKYTEMSADDDGSVVVAPSENMIWT